MKRYALVVSVALLFAAVIWSCQQQDSAPLSPEGSITLGKKPTKPKPATYEVVFKVMAPGDNFFTDVGTITAAVANQQEDRLAGEPDTLNISSFRDSFIDLAEKIRGGNVGVGTIDADDPSLWTITGEEGKCDEFARLFDLTSNVAVEDRPGEIYEGGFLNVSQNTCSECGQDLFTGWFRGEDSHGYALGISFYGIIDNPAPNWLPTNTGETSTITSTLKTHPTFDPEFPGTGIVTDHTDRLSMSFKTGKGFGKNSGRCLWGFHNHPWKIVITRN